MRIETIEPVKAEPVKAERAKPLPVDDRRAAIINAVTPLILQHGRDVTSRQMAEVSGVAEGTLFRAFGDKDSLIGAVIEHYLDPLPLRTALRSIDPDQPLDVKLQQIVAHLRNRFTGVIGMMSAIGQAGPPPRRAERMEYGSIIADVLAPDLKLLTVTPERLAQFVRLITVAASIPQFNEGQEFSNEELTALVLRGVAGAPNERKPHAS